jgi:hypothetical protein
MSIDFTTSTLSDPLHVADAIVRNGHKVTSASMWMFNGQLIADAPARSGWKSLTDLVRPRGARTYHLRFRRPPRAARLAIVDR